MFVEKIREWMLTDNGIIIIAILATLIVAVESKFTRWSPYFPIYAIFALWIPWKLGVYKFKPKDIPGNLKDVLIKHWKFILVIFIIAETWDNKSLDILNNVLGSIGLTGISFNEAINLLAQNASAKFGITVEEALVYYATFVVGWAPFGESVFYLGYIQGMLRRNHSFAFAALISASFFAVRHGTHFLFLLPDYPLAAGIIWIGSTFVFGLFMSFFYEKTSSLYPPIIVHLAVNIISIAISA